MFREPYIIDKERNLGADNKYKKITTKSQLECHLVLLVQGTLKKKCCSAVARRIVECQKLENNRCQVWTRPALDRFQDSGKWHAVD